MWTTLSRARRRLGGDPSAPIAEHDPSTPSDPMTGPGIADAVPAPRLVEDIVIIFGRAEVDRLRHALQRTLGDAVEPPNTPARIEHALALVLSLADAPGHARVLRRPAGVSTPESWEIHLDGAEHASGVAVREAGRTGRFAA